MDLNEIKNRLAKLNNKGGGSTSSSDFKANFWKPPVGEKSQIRIVPYKHNKDFPFSELYFYFGIGKPRMIALSNFDESDPILEFASQLRKTGNDENKELAKKLFPKMRTFAPVIVRGEEDKGVRLWGFGKTAYKELLNLVLNPDYGDITDAVSGRDIAVTFKTAEETGKSFPSTSIRVKPNQTPITEDASTLEALTENQKNITDIYQEQSYDDLTQALNDYLNGGSNTEEEKKEEVSATAAASSYDSKKTSDAFDDLFNS